MDMGSAMAITGGNGDTNNAASNDADIQEVERNVDTESNQSVEILSSPTSCASNETNLDWLDDLEDSPMGEYTFYDRVNAYSQILGIPIPYADINLSSPTSNELCHEDQHVPDDSGKFGASDEGSHDHDQHQQQLVATNENDIEINNIINNVQTDTHTHANCGADFDDRSSRTSQLGTDSGEESTHRSQMNSLDSEYEAEGMPEDDEGKGKPSSSETKTDVFNGDADVADADYSFKRRRLC